MTEIISYVALRLSTLVVTVETLMLELTGKSEVIKNHEKLYKF